MVEINVQFRERLSPFERLFSGGQVSTKANGNPFAVTILCGDARHGWLYGHHCFPDFLQRNLVKDKGAFKLIADLPIRRTAHDKTFCSDAAQNPIFLEQSHPFANGRAIYAEYLAELGFRREWLTRSQSASENLTHDRVRQDPVGWNLFDFPHLGHGDLPTLK